MPALRGDVTTLREVAISDVYTLFTLFSDPAVTAYMISRAPGKRSRGSRRLIILTPQVVSEGFTPPDSPALSVAPPARSVRVARCARAIATADL